MSSGKEAEKRTCCLGLGVLYNVIFGCEATSQVHPTTARFCSNVPMCPSAYRYLAPWPWHSPGLATAFSTRSTRPTNSGPNLGTECEGFKRHKQAWTGDHVLTPSLALSRMFLCGLRSRHGICFINHQRSHILCLQGTLSVADGKTSSLVANASALEHLVPPVARSGQA